MRAGMKFALMLLLIPASVLMVSADTAGVRAAHSRFGFKRPGALFTGASAFINAGSCSCAGRVCGDDGCGYNCGDCLPHQKCDGSGQCQPCVPDCAGKQCGSNGCSGSCGRCVGTDICSALNQCVNNCSNNGGLQAGAPWPMTGYCPTAQSRSPYVGSQSNNVKWTYEAGAPVYSPPTVDSSGNIYFSTTDGRYHSIDKDGKWKWSKQTTAMESYPLTIIADGSLLYTIPNMEQYLYSISSGGSLQWTIDMGNSAISAPVVGPDGTVYATTNDSANPAGGFLLAIDPSAAGNKIKWAYPSGGPVYWTPPLSLDGSLYFTNGTSMLQAVDAAGVKKWHFILDGPTSVQPVLDSDGIVIAGTSTGYVHAINPDGSEKWKVYVGGKLLGPAIGQDRSVAIGMSLNDISSVNLIVQYPFPHVKWSVPTDYAMSYSPVVDAAGNIYVGSYSSDDIPGEPSSIYAFTPLGALIWSYKTGGANLMGAIGSNGDVYVGSRDGRVYAFGQNCNPQCAGKECGDDGCGGSCGTCSQAGTCMADSSCNVQFKCTGTTPFPQGTPCSDGMWCSYGEICDGSGNCTGGTVYKCTPGQCDLTNVCDGLGGCTKTYRPDKTPCEDGNICTYNDVCDGNGNCAGTAYSCSLGPCELTSQCNGSGSCTVIYMAPTEPCSDGNDCTYGEHCSGTSNECVGGTSYVCTPGQCDLTSFCDGLGGCTKSYKAVTEPCNDGNNCTHGEHCDNLGGCVGGTTYSCPSPMQCESSNVCDGQGGCTISYKPASAACSDGSNCTYGEHCSGTDNTCMGGTSYTCTPGQCDVTSECNGLGGCTKTYKAASESCNDGNNCTYGEHCSGVNSGCVGGTSYACSAGECELTSVCDGMGSCLKTYKDLNDPCDDGEKCSKSDVCDGQGHCIGVGYNCNVGVCDLTAECDGLGGCNRTYKLANTACSDGSNCTYGEKCDGLGACKGGTQYSCIPTQCEASSLCDGAGGCTKTFKPGATPCNDGDNCTSDEKCNGSGACGGGTPYSCTPTQCEASSSCDGVGNCFKTYKPPMDTCSDGDNCTYGEKCNGTGGCGGGIPYACPQFGQCGVSNVCDGTGGCTPTFKPATEPCSDGSNCTYGEHCSGTADTCVGGTSYTCTPTQCEYSSHCDGQGGCNRSPKPATEPCTDGNICTYGEHCNGAGSCVGATPYTCVPSQCELTSVCDGTGNCTKIFKGIAAGCSTGDPCSINDHCNGQGGCVSGGINPSCIDGGTADSGADGGVPDAGFDAGADSGVDAGPDAGPVDAGHDGGIPDAGFDSGFDGGADDSGMDAGQDSGAADAGDDAGDDAGFDSGYDGGTDGAGQDSGEDAAMDAGLDAGVDAGTDGGKEDGSVDDAGPADGSAGDAAVPDGGGGGRRDASVPDAGSADNGPGCSCSSVGI